MNTHSYQIPDDSVRTGKSAEKMRLLLVEDDRRSREDPVKGIAEEGYSVDSACDGREGLRRALEQVYDLIVLDVMMPQLDGWGVLEALRDKGSKVPVLLITARDTVSDRVKGFNLGADGYLVKPFAWVEFVARLKALLRRSHLRQPDLLRVGDLEIDLPKMRVHRDGTVIDLAPKEFKLLSLLARSAGDVLSRAWIVKEVWDIEFNVDSNAVDVALGRLRKKVDDPFPQKLIHTVRGLGYILEVRHG